MRLSDVDAFVAHEPLYSICLMSGRCLQISDQVVTLVHVEVKREAGQSGDAQQEGMAYHLKDHAAEAFMMTWQTLKPALLITVKKCKHSKHHIYFSSHSGIYVAAVGFCLQPSSTYL